MQSLLLLLVLLILCSCAFAQIPWQPDEFPISYWVGPPKQFNNLETWQRVKDANFTVGGHYGGYSLEETKRMLDLCQQVGLKALVMDGRASWEGAFDDNLPQVIASLVADYGSHPATYGYYILDEPNAQLFPALANVSQELQHQDPQHLPYINLLPTYASPDQLGTPTYAEHLDRFVSIVRPAVLSYDHYALMADGSDRADYFENLALIREYGLKYGVPPWNIVLSLPHLGYRDPSEGEMRWQAYTSLAYGMKGLMWFTYWTMPEWEKEWGAAAIVKPNGEPARLYPIVQQVNGEVKTLGKTLLGLTSTGVYHTGATPRGAVRLGVDAPIRLPEDPPLVIGFFADPRGAQYAMVVNREHSKPAEFTLSVKPHVTGLTEISAADGSDKPLPLAEGKLSLSLPPGGGRLMRLTTSFVYPQLPKPLQAIAFEFGAPDDCEGWGQFNSLAQPTVKDGLLTLTFTGQDPHLIRSFINIAPDQYARVRVRMRLDSGGPEGQLFWATSAEPQFADNKYLNFPIQADGQWHEYVIPVGEHERWKGQPISAIRLDPSAGEVKPGTQVQIDWIRGE